MYFQVKIFSIDNGFGGTQLMVKGGPKPGPVPKSPTSREGILQEVLTPLVAELNAHLGQGKLKEDPEEDISGSGPEPTRSK